jgi:hypothetical protein
MKDYEERPYRDIRISIFDCAREALEKAGVRVTSTWEGSQARTLAQAKLQLARTKIRPETAARWNEAAFVVLAGVAQNSKLDPRPTAYHGQRR